MPKKTFLVRVAAQPHIAKYANIRYGNPIPLKNSNALGALAIGLMAKPAFQTKLSQTHRDIRFARLTGNIFFSLSIKEWQALGGNLTDDHILQINSFIEQDFIDRLAIFTWSQINTERRRSGYTEAIERFAHFYNIEISEDITFDGLKKMEYRRRISGKNIFPDMSPRQFAPADLLLAAI